MTRFRVKANNQVIGLAAHSNKGNANTQMLNHAIMKNWYEHEAKLYAEVLHVSFQRQKKENGETIYYYARVRYQLLIAYNTWEHLRARYLKHVEEKNIRAAGKLPPKPALTSFRAILIKELLTITIRSPRDNVCDQCVIYTSSLGTTPSVGDTELFRACEGNWSP